MTLQHDLRELERTDPVVADAALSPIGEALVLLDCAVSELDTQLPRALEAGQSAARLLADLDVTLDRLRQLRSELERTVATDLTPRQKSYEVDGVHLQVSGGRDRRWLDHRQVAWRVIESALVDEKSGEVLAEERAAWVLLDRLLQVLPGTIWWRVTALRQLGVEFGDLESWVEKRRTVRVVRGLPS
jgi:hypothetical protein